jgi:hypothetical protein
MPTKAARGRRRVTCAFWTVVHVVRLLARRPRYPNPFSVCVCLCKDPVFLSMTVVLCTGVCAINFVRSLCLYDDCASVEGDAATMSVVPYAVSVHGGGSMDMSCSDVCGVVCPQAVRCVCAINHEHVYHERDNGPCVQLQLSAVAEARGVRWRSCRGASDRGRGGDIDDGPQPVAVHAVDTAATFIPTHDSLHGAPQLQATTHTPSRQHEHPQLAVHRRDHGPTRLSNVRNECVGPLLTQSQPSQHSHRCTSTLL